LAGDTEIGALAAAFANGDPFTVIDPGGKETIVSLGDHPLCFRGSIMIAGRKRPLRHLLSCSQELADRQADGRLLLVSDEELFVCQVPSLVAGTVRFSVDSKDHSWGKPTCGHGQNA
jgi:hypothetical protein